jgi:hypothetical protein
MVLGGQPPGRVGRRRFFLSGPRPDVARAAAPDKRRAKPRSRGSRSAATPRPSPWPHRLPLIPLASAQTRGPGYGFCLYMSASDSWHTLVCSKSVALAPAAGIHPRLRDCPRYRGEKLGVGALTPDVPAAHPDVPAYGRRTKGRSASRRRRLVRAEAGVRRRVSQLGDVLPTGSRPYSPSVAKSISRSTASVSRPVILVVESNMSSYKVEGGSDANQILQSALQGGAQSALQSALGHAAELLPPVAPQTPEAQFSGRFAECLAVAWSHAP